MCAGLCWRLEEGEGEREKIKGLHCSRSVWRSRMSVNTPNYLLFIVNASLSHLIGDWPPHHSHPKLKNCFGPQGNSWKFLGPNDSTQDAR